MSQHRIAIVEKRDSMIVDFSIFISPLLFSILFELVFPTICFKKIEIIYKNPLRLFW